MPTAASSTERLKGLVVAESRAVVDVRHLLRFRAGTVRRPKVALALGLGFLLLTAAVAIVPAYVSGAGEGGPAFDVLLLLPSALAGFVIIAIVSAGASAGGRELIARDPGSIHPISPTTDHLGGLLLAPLNIAWLLQSWALLGSTAFAVGAGPLASAQIIVLLWLATGTALAQVLAWTLEGVRRVPHGIVGVRLLTVIAFGVALGLQLSGLMATVFDQIPTRWIVVGMVDGFTWRWAETALGLLVAFVVSTLLGAVPAHIAAHRIPRDELKQAGGHHAPRRTPGTVFGGLVRTDRASVWRAVPMRRGVAVLAIGPGIVALLGNLQWESMAILPGLVASGGALLYGVNAWCLDSRGALWRESLPVAPSTVFAARTYVLAEFLLAASLFTVAIAGLRAGLPTTSELVALVCTLIVVTAQVSGAAMRWSAHRSYAVDLRSARATPAPPSMMVGYSTRLAVSTTVTGLFFSWIGGVGEPALTIGLAVPLLAWSLGRLLLTARDWTDPQVRARVITTVAVA